MDELKELLGDAFVEGMSIEDIGKALEGKNLVDLSTGNYVDVAKHNKEMSELRNKLNAKEQELKTNNQNAESKNSESENLIKSLQEQLNTLNIENNKSNAIASLTEAKTLLDIKDSDNEYTSFIENVSTLEKPLVSQITTYFNKQIKSAYEKGKQDSIKNGLGDMGKQKGSSSNSSKNENFGKELAKSMMSNTPTVDYFKRN